MSSPPVFGGVRVAQSLLFCVVICRSMFWSFFSFWLLDCMYFGLRHLIYSIGLPFWYLQTCKCIFCMFVLVLMRVIFGLLVCVVVINLNELYDLARLYWPWNLVWKLNGLSIRFYILVDLGIWYCTFIDIVLFSDFIPIFGLPAHKDFYFGFPLFFSMNVHNES